MQRNSLPGPRRAWVVLAAALWALYLLGALFPRGFTWGFHFLAYQPAVVAGLFLAGTGTLILTAPRSRWLERCCAWAQAWGERRHSPASYVGLGALGLLLLALCHERVHAFGDGQNIIKWFGDNRAFNPNWFRPLWSANLSDSHETLVVALHRLLALWTAAPIATVYAVVSVLSGGLAALVWFWHCRGEAALRAWLAPLLVAALGLGGNAIYLGHVENYALPAGLAMLLLALAARRPGGAGAVAGVCALFLLVARMHIVYVMLFPVVFVVVVEALARRRPGLAMLLAPRAVALLCVVLPVVAGTMLYFLVFRAAVWRDSLPTPLFLPLSGMNPPLKPYTLFSPAHLLDFPNGLLQVLMPGAPILLLLPGWGRPAGADPRRLALAASVFLLSIFLFAANTSLSPARDWDLYALIMPPFLFLLAATVRALPSANAPRAGALLVGLVAAPFVLVGESVNGGGPGLTLRLADIAAHVYDTYYIGTGQILNTAAQIGVDRPATARVVRAAAERMQPAAQGADPEYSRVQFVLCQIEFEAKRAEQAAEHLARSIAAHPGDANTLMRAASLYELLDRPTEARACLRQLIDMEPGNLAVWKSYVRVECRRGELGSCAEALRGALARFPTDADFLELERMLKSRTPPPAESARPPNSR